MPAYSQAHQTIRKTFNISEENAEKMKTLLSPRKQTEFVNLALTHEFLRIEREQKLNKLSAKIQNIKRNKGIEPVVDTIRMLRDQQEKKRSKSPIV